MLDDCELFVAFLDATFSACTPIATESITKEIITSIIAIYLIIVI
jgi:hypothetical protein